MSTNEDTRQNPSNRPSIADGGTEPDIPAEDLINDSQDELTQLITDRAALEKFCVCVKQAGHDGLDKEASSALMIALENITGKIVSNEDYTSGILSTETIEQLVTEKDLAIETLLENDILLTASSEDSSGESIGTKILDFIIKMIEYIEVFISKYISRVARIKAAGKQLSNKLSTMRGSLPEFKEAHDWSGLYIDDTFEGDKLLPWEKSLPADIARNRQEILSKILQPLLSIITSGPASREMLMDLEELTKSHRDTSAIEVPLPGGDIVFVDGVKLSHLKGTPPRITKGNLHNPMTVATAKRNVDEIIDFLSKLSDTKTANEMVRAADKLKKALVILQRNSTDDPDMLKRVQRAIENITLNTMSQRVYLWTLGELATVQDKRLSFYITRLEAMGIRH